MSKKYDFPQNSFAEKFNEIYFDALEKVKETNEYINNTKKINLYKNILKNNYQVNSEFIEEFIDLIEEKLELEYENGINNFVKYIDYRNKIDL